MKSWLARVGGDIGDIALNFQGHGKLLEGLDREAHDLKRALNDPFCCRDVRKDDQATR